MAARRSGMRNRSLMARWMVLIEAFCNSDGWRSLCSYAVNHGFLSNSSFMYLHVFVGTLLGHPGTHLCGRVFMVRNGKVRVKVAQTAVFSCFNLALLSTILSPAPRRLIT